MSPYRWSPSRPASCQLPIELSTDEAKQQITIRGNISTASKSWTPDR